MNQIFAAAWVGSTKTALVSAAKLKNKYVNIFLLALPILAFSAGLVASGDKIIPGDTDYYFQTYEAFRRSILEFGQFPFWNPWMDGGIPLFANIQFGLISLQSPFILLFGSVIGMKIAIVLYQLVGFFGFRKLFRDGFKTDAVRSILLAYIPIFGSFFVLRTIAGHFTFLLIAFVPWLIYFFIGRDKKYSWLWFALIYSFMIWSTPHYTTIMSLMVVGVWFLYEVINRLITARRSQAWKEFLEKTKKDLFFFMKAGGLILVFCAYRLFFVVQYLKDFPRLESAKDEPFTGLYQGLYSIWGPDQYRSPPLLPSNYGWVETATYIGIGTLVCLLLVAGVYGASRFIRKHKDAAQKLFAYPVFLLGALFSTFFVLGMGNFGELSPYRLLNHLPVFDSMRVPTRWLLWSALFALFILAVYKGAKFKKAINIILFLTVIELFMTGSHIMGKAFFVRIDQYRSPQAAFNQVYLYRIPRPAYLPDKNFQTVYWYDENLTETTRNNLGQVIAGDSLVDTRIPGSTIRCGSNQINCRFTSENVKMTYWSPNKIVLERTAPGSVNINMNPGRGWKVNGKYIFAGYKVTDPHGEFIIDDPAQTITLEYAPSLSPKWIFDKLPF